MTAAPLAAYFTSTRHSGAGRSTKVPVTSEFGNDAMTSSIHGGRGRCRPAGLSWREAAVRLRHRYQSASTAWRQYRWPSTRPQDTDRLPRTYWPVLSTHKHVGNFCHNINIKTLLATHRFTLEFEFALMNWSNHCF